MSDKNEATPMKNDQQDFVEGLEQASQIVRSWPIWKQKVLGTINESDRLETPTASDGAQNNTTPTSEKNT